MERDTQVTVGVGKVRILPDENDSGKITKIGETRNSSTRTANVGTAKRIMTPPPSSLDGAAKPGNELARDGDGNGGEKK